LVGDRWFDGSDTGGGIGNDISEKRLKKKEKPVLPEKIYG
jgi:hypothetical protein